VSAADAISIADAPQYGQTPLKELLVTVRELAVAGRWRDLIAFVAALGEFSRHHELVRFEVTAAIEIHDCELIDALATIAVESGWTDEQKTECASDLVNANFPMEAWRILSATSGLFDGLKNSKVAQRIIARVKDVDLRQAVKSRMVVQARPDSVFNEAGYRAQTIKEKPSLGTLVPRITVDRCDDVPVGLEERVREIMSGFTAKLRVAPAPIVRVYEDVFVNQMGQIWREDGTALRGYGRPVPAGFGRCSVPQFDELFSCSKENRGYYEWFVDRLGGLSWRLSAEGSDCPILIHPDQMGLATESLGLMGLPPDRLVAAGPPMFCRRLMVSGGSTTSLIYWAHFAPVYQKLVALAEERYADRPKVRRFFISRRDTNRRAMDNEVALEDAMEAAGIQPIMLSTLGLLEKVHLFHNAELVIGAHGAGFSHLLVAGAKLQVVELVPVSASHFGHLGTRVCFAQLSQMRELKHKMVLHPMNPTNASWHADIPKLLKIVDQIG
jgi:hypothetical protein